MKVSANTSTNFKIIRLSSSLKLSEDDIYMRKFFLLDEGNLIAKSIEEFEKMVGANLNHLSFRNRLIPEEKIVKRLEINELYTQDESSSALAIKTKLVDSVVEEPETKPLEDIDGIITDLYVRRYDYFDPRYPDNFPQGLGIVAWAIMHSIPVGLIADNHQFGDDRMKNFWYESVLDTLEMHPCCILGKIPSGSINRVCHDMRELILNQYDLSINGN
ncbi:hypothetical protein IPJ63_03625 [Candidatus Nomurabacteria bacterium]|nr:MAG: hypothetical protein IPJ63_03625 [Candidatus Nomurabacteria bacterium]